VCFLVGLDEEMTPGSVVGCAENILIVNTLIFARFHFFTYLVNWMIFNRLFNVFVVAFNVLGKIRLKQTNSSQPGGL
jgi:hypothetical protein